MISRRGSISVEEKLAVLNCRRLPGRLNPSETALLLGLQEHDIAALVTAKLLVPLGKPAANSPKYFALWKSKREPVIRSGSERRQKRWRNTGGARTSESRLIGRQLLSLG